MQKGSAVAVITGASSGIGRATAEAFAARGYQLVLGARRGDRLRTVCDAIARRHGVGAIAVPCDVRRAEDVQALVETAVARFGRLSVLVNNAGIGFYARVEDTTETDLRDLIETNLLGAFYGVRAAVPVMRRQRHGHIVIVGSVVGKRSWPFHGAYAASKAGLGALTQALRAELAGSGVTASLILPGSVRTSFFRSARVNLPGYRPRPLGIVQSPERVAYAILRSVEHPAPEINTVAMMRVAWVLAEAVPRLPDLVARGSYLWMARRLGLGASRSTSEAAARTTDGRE